MSYTAYLTPRKETISDEGVEGIIDLANVEAKNKSKIEANPELFFDLTYPTSDILRVLEHINLRFKSSKKSSSGLFLFEGLKGTGKSHILLLVYDIFKYPSVARKWLSQNKIKREIPDDVIVLINKFTDRPFDSIWNFIFEALGKKAKKSKTHPDLEEFKTVLGDKQIVLIFDELEQGIRVIADPALKAQNIAFLQMISEFSNRSKQITLFVSIYGDRDEPGSTLKRVPRCEVKFDNTKDRNNVILHRLFENYLKFDRASVTPVIDSYIQLWKQHVKLEEENVKLRFQESYPFSPSLMDIVLKKIPSKGGFQNVRGALSFLGNLVKLTHTSDDIITPANASLGDRETVAMLKDLDIGGDLINRAKENMEELKSKVSIANKFAADVLLYTITGFDTNKGVTFDEIVKDILSPTLDINDINQALMNFQKYASYFHTEGDRYFFDIEEQPEAKVELKSLQYQDDHARELIVDLMKTEVFRNTDNTVVFNSVEQVQQQLEQFDKNRPRYVIAGRRLTQEERHTIYYGMSQRNLILLLEPNDDKFQLLSDKDLLKWAKRVRAAKNLAEGTRKSSRQADYERIARADQTLIIDRIKKAGLVFINWEEYGSNVNDDRVELEPIAGDCSKDKVLEALSQQYFPMLTIKEHLESRLDLIKEKLVKDIDAEYKATLGFPVPVYVRAVSNAIRELCKDGTIGIQHSRGNFCKKNPDITETEFFNAKITDPFEEPPIQCPRCGKYPCICTTPPPPQKCPRCDELPCVCTTPPPETCPNCGQDPCVCSKRETITLGILPQTNIGSLREEVAAKLQEYQDIEIIKVVYKIFYQQDNIGDMSTLPAVLRGNLSGQGGVSAEIQITKTGRFSKSQIEQQIESLPSLSGADYSADLMMEVEE